ncbi:MAG TPA: dihydrofolate reductase [Devosia sp.]
MLTIEGHAIVSADGMIADAAGEYPPALKNEADWAQYQRALDQAALVVTGRRGHERFPNPGRRRLVVTHRVAQMGPDPNDKHATYWNPAGLPLRQALAELGISNGIVAITGVFDLFVTDYDRFVLSESNKLLIPGGTPCFAAGHPRQVLAGRGLRPIAVELIDPAAMVTTTVWER